MSELNTLDALFTTMGEYTRMDGELAFGEFQSFYTALMDFLQREYQRQQPEDLVRLAGITGILAANAQIRAQRKDERRKKFVKMGEKASFWNDAIRLRLGKEGLDQEELDRRVAALWSEPAAEAAAAAAAAVGGDTADD